MSIPMSDEQADTESNPQASRVHEMTMPLSNGATATAGSGLLDLPPEILTMCFEHLPYEKKVWPAYRLVCKAFKERLSSPGMLVAAHRNMSSAHEAIFSDDGITIRDLDKYCDEVENAHLAAANVIAHTKVYTDDCQLPVTSELISASQTEAMQQAIVASLFLVNLLTHYRDDWPTRTVPECDFITTRCFEELLSPSQAFVLVNTLRMIAPFMIKEIVRVHDADFSPDMIMEISPNMIMTEIWTSAMLPSSKSESLLKVLARRATAKDQHKLLQELGAAIERDHLPRLSPSVWLDILAAPVIKTMRTDNEITSEAPPLSAPELAFLSKSVIREMKPAVVECLKDFADLENLHAISISLHENVKLMRDDPSMNSHKTHLKQTREHILQMQADGYWNVLSWLEELSFIESTL